MLNDVQLKTYSKYINKGFSNEQLEEIRSCIKFRLEVRDIANIEYSPTVMYYIKIAKLHDKDLIHYIKAGFSKSQLYEICLGLIENLNVNVYAKLCFTALQMKQIRMVMEKGLNPFVIAHKELNEKQMEQISLGMEYGVDVSLYCNPSIPYDKMKSKREALMTAFLSDPKLLVLQRGINNGINMQPYKDFNINFLAELINWKLVGLDTTPFEEGYTDVISLQELRVALLQNLNILKYVTPFHNCYQILSIRNSLLKRLKVNRICNPNYDNMQMFIISLSLDKGVDITDDELENYDYSSLIFDKIEERKQKEYERMRELGLINIKSKTSKLEL